jgi:hypothetical protein
MLPFTSSLRTNHLLFGFQATNFENCRDPPFFPPLIFNRVVFLIVINFIAIYLFL